MTRRHWVFTLGVGLCGGLLSGCTHAHPRSVAASERVIATPGREEAQGIVAAPAAPYAQFGPPGLKTKDAPSAETAGAPRPPEDPPAPPAITIGPPTDLAPDGSAGTSLEPVVAAKAAENPALMEALRCFLEKRPEEALCKLKDLDKASQDLLVGLLPVVARLGAGNLDKATPQEIAELTDGLDRVLAPLRARAPLTMETICFCQKIGAFGVYEPLPPEHRFREGEPVQIYVQLRNFTSTTQPSPSGPGKHVIQLAGSAEIYDEAGNKVWPHDTLVFERRGAQADESRTLRHDYFERYTFIVPRIPPGTYVLRVRVEDRGTQPPRVVRGSLDFRITNAPAPSP